MSLQPVTTADEYLAAILAELQALRALLEPLGGLLQPPPSAPEGEVELREPKPRHRDATHKAKG